MKENLLFYNSLSKKKEKFVPIDKNQIKIYSCGPTVYNFAHIGNFRAYLFADLLVRTLKYFNYDVLNVMNITDVDDKTIKGSKLFNYKTSSPNILLEKFTSKYIDYFIEDLNSLKITMPKIMPKATESIKEMEFIIQKLYEKNYAYVLDDGIYFDLKKAKKYGVLEKIDFDSQKYNRENRLVIDEYEKDNIQDFVLWKFKKTEDEPFWEIMLENDKYLGRPGWHIECSAMSLKYLGEKFDIHTGGVDLKFPHHENEICQSSHALGIENQANFWMHNEHLLVDGKKMSKSLNNFYTLRDLLEKKYSPLALRELFLRSHYRQQVNFTFESLNASEANLKKINDFYLRFKNQVPNSNEINIKNLVEEKLSAFENALLDDLNTPLAFSILFEFMNEVNKFEKFSKDDIDRIINFLEKIDKILDLLKKDIFIPNEVLELAKKRSRERENKNFKEADNLREEILKLGYEIKDSKDTKESFILNKI